MSDLFPLVFLAFMAGFSLGLCLGTRTRDRREERADPTEAADWWQRGAPPPEWDE